jgi:hypothetical protein
MNSLHDFPTLSRLARFLPAPSRALHLARLLIPLSIFTGIVLEPLYRWVLPG